MTYACKNGLFCHKYGKNHEAETCTSVKDGKRCLSCPTVTDHKLWMAACPKFKLEKQIATEKFKNRFAKYPNNFFEVFKFGLKINSNSEFTSVSGSGYASAALDFLNLIPSSQFPSITSSVCGSTASSSRSASAATAPQGEVQIRKSSLSDDAPPAKKGRPSNKRKASDSALRTLFTQFPLRFSLSWPQTTFTQAPSTPAVVQIPATQPTGQSPALEL